MQIDFEREALLEPVSMVVGVVERRQTLPILSYVMLQASEGRVSLTGTDLEVEMVASVSTIGIKDPQDVMMPARKLFDICRALPANSKLTIIKEGEKVAVKAGRSRFTLSTLPVEDFPSVSTNAFEHALTISGEVLQKFLGATAFCMAHQDVRYYLNGVYLEIGNGQLTSVATDGHRMAVCRGALEGGGGDSLHMIVPRKAVQEILRLIDNGGEPVEIEISTNHVRLKYGTVTFTSKLIDGKFPDYTKVIPTSQNKHITINRTELRESLGRVAILANEKYRGVRFNLGQGQLGITAHNPEQEEAVEEIEVDYSGEPLEIGFNVNYLMEAVSALSSTDVVLGLSDSSSSCTLRSPEDSGTQYIIMPMRL